jgi:phage tail-like protein
MTEDRSGRGQGNPVPLAVSHVAEPQRRYPGEDVSFYTRVEVLEPLRGFKLQVSVPPGMVLGTYRALNGTGDELPVVAVDEGTSYVIWSRKGEEAFTGRFEYEAKATIAPARQGCTLESRAVVTATDGHGEAREAERAAVAVAAKGRYLRYLPSIYQDDELMGRLLMLFESFLAPVDSQVDNLSFYFDPQMAPPEFLPWLASWINLVLDDRWPERKRRQLLSSAARLYRMRGTRQGLEEYLKIYSGEKPEIVEHRAHNFRLGREARLGPSVALGIHNEPHTFTVTLPPPLEPAARDGEDREISDGRWQSARRRRWQSQIEAIIDAEKPAHTGYRIVIRDSGGRDS